MPLRGGLFDVRVTTRQSPFGAHPFSVADGLRAGLGVDALAGPRFLRPFHGVRQWRESGEREGPGKPTERELLRRLCAQYAPRLRPGQFFAGESALVLLGAPTPDAWQRAVHVAAYRPAAAPRTRGVVGHRLAARDPAPWRAFGLPLEHPARAWVQASADWHSDDLIAAADFLVARRRPLVTLEDLRAEAAWARRPGVAALLDEVRDGSESPKETKLRLTLVRAGLPEPELAVEIFAADGTFIARLDQVFPRYRVAVEYDGRQHASDARQFQRDADRWDAIRAAGWDHVRILSHHLDVDGGRAAIEEVRAALGRGGWIPPK